MNYPGYFAPQHALCTDEIENLRGSLRESMDLTKQYYDASCRVARERDAALDRVRDLETAISPILTYLTALVESADQQGNLRGNAPDDRLAAVNDVWLRRSDIAALAAAAQEQAGAGESNLLIIDTTNAHMVRMPNTSATASTVPSSFTVRPVPPAPPDLSSVCMNCNRARDGGSDSCACSDEERAYWDASASPAQLPDGA